MESYLELAYEFAEDAAHTVGGCVGCAYDIVTIVDEVIIEVPAFVGDDRHTEDADTSVACDDDFGHGAHADGVTTRARPVGVLGRRLVGGTREADVHTFVDVDAELLSDGLSLRDEFAVVGARHIWEAWPEHLDVGADEWVGGGC